MTEYQELVEDLKGLIVEAGFNSRWELVRAYHELGKRVNEANEMFEREKIYGEKIVQRLAKSLRLSERTIHYAIQFHKQYPELDLLPAGKNVSWTLVTKLLTAPKEECQHLEVEEITIKKCKNCHKKIL